MTIIQRGAAIRGIQLKRFGWVVNQRFGEGLKVSGTAWNINVRGNLVRLAGVFALSIQELFKSLVMSQDSRERFKR